jgi:type IV pilus assembly protein PilB
MGVKPFLVASSIQAIHGPAPHPHPVQGVQAQADPNPDPKFLHLVGITPEEGVGKILKGAGCPACNNTGYRGRKAIFEMMMMNARSATGLQARAVSEIAQGGTRLGMRPLVADGKIKVLVA